MTFSAGDTVHVTIEGTVISTTQGSFVAVSFRDAYANPICIRSGLAG